MGIHLRELRKTERKEVVSATGKVRHVSQIAGQGVLTDFVIDNLARYFGIRIRRKVNTTVQEMRNEVKSTISHCTSMDDKPQHDLCSKIKDSWCFYQNALANSKAPAIHKEVKVTFQLKPEQFEKVNEVY